MTIFSMFCVFNFSQSSHREVIIIELHFPNLILSTQHVDQMPTIIFFLSQRQDEVPQDCQCEQGARLHRQQGG
jgi:hypothetical protein